MNLTQRDWDILSILAKIRFCNTYQFKQLLDYKTLSDSTDKRGIENNLRKLYDYKLILSRQLDYKVYYLTEKGANEYHIYRNLHKDTKISTYKWSNIVPHDLQVTQFYVELYNLKENGFQLKAFSRSKYPFNIIDPDAMFNIVDNNQVSHYGFNETDMGTEKYNFIINKFLKYSKLYGKKQLQTDLGYFPPIYFVTTTKSRVERLQSEINKVKKLKLLPIHISTFEDAYNNFLDYLLGGFQHEKKKV